MTVRRMRGASLGVAGALAAGLVIAPSGGATAGSDGPPDPVFYEVSAQEVVPVAGDSLSRARSSAYRTAESAVARAATANSIQILQSVTGLEGVGSNGVAVAAGPKHVVQAAGLRIRALNKTTLAVPKGGQKTLLKFFGLSSPVVVTQPAVVYDPVGKRFIAAAVANDAGDIGLVMRISKGTAATPLTKKKWLKSVEFATAASDSEPGIDDAEESQPLIGVSSNKIVVTAIADDPNNATIANRIFFFPKTDYYAGAESGGWAASVNDTYDGQAPAVNASKQANAFVAIPDTGDVTVTTYTGAATTSAPSFSKNVMYPSNALTPPPLVNQTGGDNLDLGGLAFTGVAWRKNKLFAATTVNSGGRAAVRVFGVNTGSGVSLASDETLESGTADWFNPDLAIDGAGNVMLAANDEGTVNGPSLAVFARKGSTWLDPRFIVKATDVVDNPVGGSLNWRNTTGAALDPTSPWDVWVSGAVGASSVTDGLSTKIARVSVAKNKATIKASDTSVNKGAQVTFTLKLSRPESADVIKGLPVALQRKGGGAWKKIDNGVTNKKGVFKSTKTVTNPGQYRTLGKAVLQVGGEGVSIERRASKAISISIN